MPTPLTNSRLRKALHKVRQPQTGWIDVSDKVMGTADGTVLTGIAGMIYVRDPQNGQVITVYNSIAPTDRPGLQVKVGRLVGENIYRVKGLRDAYGTPAGGGQISPHSHNDLYLGRERFLPFLVLPISGGGLTIQIYGDTLVKADGTFGWIENQTLDLTSHAPAAGALYVLIEADDDGTIYATDGTPVAAKEVLTPTDIPAITAGRKASCAVRLYDGQTQLYRDPATINDFVDLRSFTSGGGGSSGGVGAAINAAAADTPLDADEFGFWDVVDAALKKITWANIISTLTTAFDALYSAIGHTHSYMADDADYSTISTNDADTDITGLELEELSDGSETILHSHAGSGGGDGWTAGTGTWSYSSADDPTFVISVDNDQTALIGVGDRVKYTQATGGTKYGIVTAVGAYSGGVTLITIYGGTDYNLENEAISNPYYSHVKNPFGFPPSPAKWSESLADTTQRSRATPTQNTWYNAGTLSLALPIGVWEVELQATFGVVENSASSNCWITLSTANNSESNTAMTALVNI
ncbi:MAG: hypothetical protein EHM40_20045, partial [Chloroflexi bacterium]